jgi:hypothetical protein
MVLKKGEILNISLGPNHGKELAIRRHSDDVWYFLVVGSPPADMVSLMTPSEFSIAKSIKIGPKTTGYKWTCEGGNEISFSEPGMYTIYVIKPAIK